MMFLLAGDWGGQEASQRPQGIRDEDGGPDDGAWGLRWTQSGWQQTTDTAHRVGTRKF